MPNRFPSPSDHYPIVYLEDTDHELPPHVMNRTMRYTQFKVVASGGKCIIQSCRDYHLGRIVAYKSLRKELAEDPVEQKRFLREARVTAMLQHPNTIPIYELSRDNRGHYFFTMKLVEGSTLREIIDLSKESSSDFAEGYVLDNMISIIIQIGHALDYAHSHGVLHRDVKPANILIGPFGEVMLLDWGLAKVWNQNDDETGEIVDTRPFDRDANPALTSRGPLQGTALYMSPEQIARSRNIDGRSDVYSLGTVLYEILTLQPMVAGETTAEVIQNATESVPSPPSEMAPERNIPSELEAICMACVAKDPADRLQSPRDLVQRLRAWRGGAESG